MKRSELKALVGKSIRWEENQNSRTLRSDIYAGVVLQVSSKNMLVDMNGNAEWKWIPSMKHLTVIEQ